MFFGQPNEVYEQSGTMRYPSFVGHGMECYLRLQQQYGESTTWEGALFFVLLDGSTKQWRRQKIYLH